MNKDDIKKEARILAMIADHIAHGNITITEKQLEMIINLNNELYRGYIKSKEKEKDAFGDIEK